MSALTKVFIVLHVVLSLVLTAGLIVFVNTSQNFKADRDTWQAKAGAADKASREAQQQVLLASAQRDAAIKEKDNQLAARQAELQSAQATIADLNTKTAELNSNMATLTAANSSATEAIKLAQGSLAAEETQMADLRKQSDNLTKQYADASLRITDLTNKLDVTTRRFKDAEEQNAQLASDLAQKNQIIEKNGISASPAGGPINASAGVPSLNGVVRDKKIIAGVPYATISLGSADAVTKDMQFKVIDPNRNQFLGYLTVDTVEAHEATGRLDGPNVQAIRPGVEVRTQL